MQCVWLNADDARCSSPGERHMGLCLCDEHYGNILLMQGWIARQSARYLGFDAFPGYCYLATLGRGRVKIGFVNTAKGLSHRMTALTRQRGYAIPLAVLSGGFVREAALHYQFRHLRIPGENEVFWCKDDLAAFVCQVQGTEENLLCEKPDGLGAGRYRVRARSSPARGACAAAVRAYSARQDP